MTFGPWLHRSAQRAYEDDEDLDDIMEELFTEIECDASRYSCYPQRLDALEIGKERCW